VSLVCCITAGWHHKRYEFEPEWDNDAEASIAEIEFRENDTPEEEAAKLRLLEIYNKRLDEVCVVVQGLCTARHVAAAAASGLSVAVGRTACRYCKAPGHARMNRALC
jgi:hypothetical protein